MVVVVVVVCGVGEPGLNGGKSHCSKIQYLLSAGRERFNSGERERERERRRGGKKETQRPKKNAKDNSYRIMHGKSRP